MAFHHCFDLHQTKPKLQADIFPIRRIAHQHGDNGLRHSRAAILHFDHDAGCPLHDADVNDAVQRRTHQRVIH